MSAELRAGRWRLFAACGLALVFAVGTLAWEMVEEIRQAQPGASGRLLMPQRGGLVVFDFATRQSRELLPAAQNSTVTAATWSPDRARVAYAQFHRRPDDTVSSSELFVLPTAGGTPDLIVPRDRPGTLLDTPVWAPDGRMLYFAYQGLDGRRPVVRVERIGMPGGGTPQVLYEDASFPALSPDGRAVVFVKDDPAGQGLWVGASDGGDAREMLQAGLFKAIMGPRFAPDGSRVAFTAQGSGPQANAGSRATSLLEWFRVPVAEAHGEPWNIWTVRPDGTDPRRLSFLQEDEPLVAWSPDGRWLAVLGTGGLWLLDPSGVRDPQRIGEGSFGAIDWAS
ncbi:MAG TPA: hypothetical protein VEQ11_07520 [Chloroflexota bacterium]|nr:hypothetical protein [Chloroflexota bacterium]